MRMRHPKKRYVTVCVGMVAFVAFANEVSVVLFGRTARETSRDTPSIVERNTKLRIEKEKLPPTPESLGPSNTTRLVVVNHPSHTETKSAPMERIVTKPRTHDGSDEMRSHTESDNIRCLPKQARVDWSNKKPTTVLLWHETWIEDAFKMKGGVKPMNNF